jgi:hypothetical protein
MATVTKKDVTVTKDQGNGPMAELPEYVPGTEWATATEYADQILGHDLAKDDLFDALVGVPFLITRVVFRKGIKRRNGVQAAYASCEAVIAPEAVLKKRRVNLDILPFEPGSAIVFNDGSTGVCRQIVAYLAATGRIELPDNLPEEGPYGESRYDLPPSDWTEAHAGEYKFDGDDFTEYSINIRLQCPRGVRVSEYVNDYNPTGSKTRYLA